MREILIGVIFKMPFTREVSSKKKAKAIANNVIEISILFFPDLRKIDHKIMTYKYHRIPFKMSNLTFTSAEIMPR